MELNAKPRKLTALLEEVNGYPHAKTAVGLTNKATKVIKDMYINACTYNIEFLVYRQYLPWEYVLLPLYGLRLLDARL
jgi:hypothetical protein